MPTKFAYRFAYGTITLYGALSQHASTTMRESSGCLRTPSACPSTPNRQRPQPLTSVRFGLFPFRSPLLRESLLISLPPGTEMFHFPGCPPLYAGVLGSPGRVAPFGYLRVKGRLRLSEAFRSLPRPSSAVGTKASTVRPLYLNLSSSHSVMLLSMCNI